MVGTPLGPEPLGGVSTSSDWGPNSKFGNIHFVVHFISMPAARLDPQGKGRNLSGIRGLVAASGLPGDRLVAVWGGG